jgi:hypothetical protein
MGNHIVNVKVGTNLNRTTVMVASDTTIRKILEDNGINYETSTVYLDGINLKAGEMDKTLNDFNIAENCYIIAAQKTENA